MIVDHDVSFIVIHRVVDQTITYNFFSSKERFPDVQNAILTYGAPKLFGHFHNLLQKSKIQLSILRVVWDTVGKYTLMHTFLYLNSDRLSFFFYLVSMLV
jgi:hypothetical protein